MKNSLVLSITLLIFAGCNNATAPKAKSGKSAGGAVKSNSLATAKVLRVKNYNQYNMTLAKMTGLDRSKYNTLFDTLKASLPADNDIGGLTPFNLIAMTRLADAYCKDYIDFKATTDLTAELTTLQIPEVREYLFTNFLDMAEGEEKFASLKVEVENVLKNDDGLGGELFPNVTNSLEGNKNLASAACVTILASSYITLLE